MTDGTTTANPLLVQIGLPDYARIQPEHVVPAVKETVATALKRLEEIERSLTPTWAGTMEPIEELEQPFERAWKPVGHLFGVKNSPELRAAYDEAQPLIVEFSLRVRQSEPLYKALLGIKNNAATWSALSGTQQRIIADRIKDAELAGIGLPAEKRERFNAIEQELSQLSTDFSNHVLDATKAWSLDITDAAKTEGWPSSLKQLSAQTWSRANPDSLAATPDAGPWKITLEAPIYVPFMEHGRDRNLREQVYRAFITRASQPPFDNSPLMTRVLQLRKEKAALLGYPHFAAVSLMRKMAPSVDAIQKMYDQLHAAAWNVAQRDLQDLVDFKAKKGDTTPLRLWDIAFWAERVREDRYAYTDEEVRPYFSLEKVLDGLFRLCTRLFGVTIERITNGVSTWHPDVRYYVIRNEGGEPIASFFLDPYSRPEDKRGGAWMDDCLGRRTVNGQTQLPVAHLVCNQTPPVGDKPALMTFREVETLFHEMGHGLQHMLTKIEHPDAAGINGVEWDAVELPSQFMENWCYHRPTLMGMTGHFETGAPLPEALFQKICAARNYRAATMLLRQMMLGMTDLELHTTFDPNGSMTPFEVQRRVSEKTAVMPLLPEDRFLCGFSHIFAGGYAAGY
ncbi:MAG TPA: M3 family metallopeptidase, partial [Planctomycetaceae bacterium]|nr:M3 family metallopeptidase [Planctomycetaceae bacterium]